MEAEKEGSVDGALVEELAQQTKPEPEEEPINLRLESISAYPVNTSTDPFTSSEIQLLKCSMDKMIEAGRRKTARKLIIWMFLNIKGMADKFPSYISATGDILGQDQRFIAHALAVFMSLEQLVMVTDSDIQFESKLAEIAHLHIQRKQGPIKSHYFKTFRKKFRYFLIEVSVSIPDKKLVHAWEKLLSKLAAAILVEEKKYANTSCCLLS